MRVVYSTKYKNQAKLVIDDVLKTYGSCQKYKEEAWGKEINKEEILSICDKYLEVNKLDVNVYFGNSLVTTMSGNGLSLVGTQNYYRDLRFRSLLDHEIGTHYIRSLNQRQLDEDSLKHIKKVRIGWQLATEEGLASISNHIHYENCDLFFIPALLYYAVCISQESSFWDTFKMISKYVSEFDDCWLQTLRVKRGMGDTSKPGGFCKDQATFDGAMRILENQDKIDFNAIYAGKVSLETYFESQELLKEAVNSKDYTCPPQLKGAKNKEFFIRRVKEMYTSHQALFEQHRIQQQKQQSLKNMCNNPIRPPLCFNQEGFSPIFVKSVDDMDQKLKLDFERRKATF
mmetsp:Transcript_3488/g.5934  ORF Transcript_3488/g.5934 Transcript_3488/m.5934 type:complete len:344 (-) Transcript_3488:703-1734(-)